MEMTQRQEQIVEKAIKLIAEHGIQSVTIKNLAHEIGVSEPALYRHFKNKFEILDAVIEFFILKAQPAIKKLREAQNPLVGIENFIKMHFKIFNENNNLGRVIFSESNFQNEAKLLGKLTNLMNGSRITLENVITKGQAVGQIRSDIDSSSIFRIIIGSLRLLVTQWSMSNMAFNLQDEGDKLCNDIIKIIKV